MEKHYAVVEDWTGAFSVFGPYDHAEDANDEADAFCSHDYDHVLTTTTADGLRELIDTCKCALRKPMD